MKMRWLGALRFAFVDWIFRLNSRSFKMKNLKNIKSKIQEDDCQKHKDLANWCWHRDGGREYGQGMRAAGRKEKESLSQH